MITSLGIIEGYYGRIYTEAERQSLISFISDIGYSYYIYAPKNDCSLRLKWDDKFSKEKIDFLKRLSLYCKNNSIEFGIGISPLAITSDLKKYLPILLNKVDFFVKELKTKERLSILILGVACLLFVPVFKTITHLPPFVGILFGLGVLWFFTEMMYRRKERIHEDLKLRVTKIVQRIDGTTLLFFLGILLAVDALRYAGILDMVSEGLDKYVGNVYAVNMIIGTLSAIVDNVPLVAGAIAMYPVATDAMVLASSNPEYLTHFTQDGIFWQFLAYCAGVGGSMLIIGSAAGVVVMGLERINFLWYLRVITPMAVAGYLAGAGVYIIQNSIFP